MMRLFSSTLTPPPHGLLLSAGTHGPLAVFLRPPETVTVPASLHGRGMLM